MDRRVPALGQVRVSEYQYYEFRALDRRLTAAQQRLATTMKEYWTNFAKTGDPNGPGLPKWPKYDGNSGWQVMRLDATSEAKPDALRGRYLFLDSEWGKAAGK